MTSVDYSLERVSRVLKTVESLKESEFPYNQSKEALDDLERVFLQSRDLLVITKGLEGLDDTTDLIQTACAQSAEKIFTYYPFLGFILRSTNVRNAFEVHGPLLKMARQLLGEDIKLLVASEWDYSPFTYTNIPGMDSFILLGLPASESSNPLLIPLAGHELVLGCRKKNGNIRTNLYV